MVSIRRTVHRKLRRCCGPRKLHVIIKNDDSKCMFVNAAHPGAVATPILYKQGLQSWVVSIFDLVNDIFLWSPLEGALTESYLGVAIDQLKSKKISVESIFILNRLRSSIRWR
mmetsp:Transcript_55303/g.134327  ORF Transcript_55303/g.134327 Transcript_55303/m.134327 type:complete len:113 (+) Transcript_55303:859-1197(+)